MFFEGSRNNYIQIYELNESREKSLIVYFPTGIPVYFFEDYINEYAEIHSNEDNLNTKLEQIKYTPISKMIGKLDNLVLLINYILSHLQSDEYSKIILSGHSNGMSSATTFAYILNILAIAEVEIKTFVNLDENYIKNINNFINYFNKKYPDIVSAIRLNKSHLQDKLFICGTAGFPNLWTNRNEFDVFNDFYKGKYIHIISSFTNIKEGQEITIYDNISYHDSYKPYINFGSVVFNLNMSNKEIKCFYLESILDNNYNNFDDKKYKIHEFNFYRYLYNKYFSRRTKNNRIFNTYKNI